MKRFLALLLLSAPLYAANNPPYKSSETATQENFRDIYQEHSKHRHSGSDGSSRLQDVIPDADSLYDVGASGREWARGFFDSLTAGSLTVAGVSISTKTPTVQIFTSGSGTYTTPTGARWIVVRMIGGGGGGGGSGTGVGSGGTGSTGGSTTFSVASSTLTAGGGTGGPGAPNSGFVSGAGGTASGGDINSTGFLGQTSICGNVLTNCYGSPGGSSFFGSGGTGGTNGGAAGNNAAANTGGGGGGAGGNAGTAFAATGGSTGGYVEKLYVSPSASYSYSIGGGGNGGTAGTSGAAGGNGGSGLIIVREFY